ncbi:Ig-like domain-containing protein [Halorubrum sp. DTA46]|uniref:Ig-like domain-containing protein n=1 Tax=Halorubrum sp. DTA46 TaxID=3402162 RepID=UPI003AAC07CB
MEGFAAYYEAAVSGNPNAVYWGGQNIESNEFYDTHYDGRCANNPGDGSYDGLQVEGSVASILWAISDGEEPLPYSFSKIADIIERNPQGIDDFYQMWDDSGEAELDVVYTEFGIDKLPPKVKTSFGPTPYTSNSVTLDGSVVDDETETESVEISVGGSSYETIASGDGTWSTTRTIQDGTHIVQVRTKDIHGNTNETEHEVRVSSEAPVVDTDNSQVPEYGAPGTEIVVGFTHETRFPESATVTVLDQGGSEVASRTVSNVQGGQLTQSESVSIGLPNDITDGEYDIQVTVEDESGRADTSTNAEIVVDTTLPNINDVTVADTYVNASTPLEVSVAAEDTGTIQSGVADVEVVDAADTDRTAALSADSDEWDGTFDPDTSDGTHTALITVTDAAGNVNQTSISYDVDNQPPSVNAIAPRYTNASAVNVSGTVTDRNLTAATLTTNRSSQSGQLHLLSASGNYDETVDLSLGSNRIIIEATDRAGNTAEFAVSIGRDEMPPNGSLAEPGRVGGGDGPGATNQTDPMLVLSVSDNLAGMNETATASTARIDGQSVPADGDHDDGTLSVKGESLADGSHELTVELVDRAGNSREVTESFVVDTVSPEIDDVDLHDANNRTVLPTDPVPVTVNATDDRTGVGSVLARDSTLAADGDSWTGSTSAPLRIGNRTIEIRAIDAAGNVQQQNLSVYVGLQQTVPVTESGLATGESPDDAVDDVTIQIATDENGTAINGSHIELTSAVTTENPEDTPVPDDHVVYYPQHDFNVSSDQTEGGNFNATVSLADLREARGIPESVEFWVFNETTDGWRSIDGEALNGSDGELAYRVQTPHYSTFAVSSDVDDTAPNVTIDSPSTTGEVEANELRIRASFEDEGIGVDPNATVLTIDGESVDLNDAETLTNASLDVSTPVDPGNRTISLRVSDAYGNERNETWTVTVTEPLAHASGGGDGGGGGGGQSGDDASLTVDMFESDGGATIRLSDIPRSSEADIDTDGVVSGTPFEVSGIWMDFLFDPSDFRIETTDPRVDAPGSALPSDAGTPVGYLTADVIGVEERKVAEMRVSFSVRDDAFPEGASVDEFVAYQRVDGEWITLDTAVEGDVVVATLETTTAEQIALAAEAPGDGSEESSDEETNGTESQTVTASEDRDTGLDIPGFGVPVAVIALLAAVVLLRRP